MTIHFEIRIDEQAVIESFDKLRRQWKEYLQSRSATIDAMTFQHAPVQLCYGGDYSICSEGTTVPVPSILLTETTSFEVHTFLLSTEEPSIEELEPSEGGGSDHEWTAACENVTLPHLSLHTSWESLLFEGSIKQQLFYYATSALHFADKQVSGHLVHWNRLVLLWEPPGTGKTSLCRALAQKLAIRMNRRYSRACLLEIHSHSLFSKWFSTSGKLIHKLFDLIQEMLQEDSERLVCVLMDEIESLAASRSAASSSEPTDAMRAVNSLLTGLDRLRHCPNVLLLATTNLTQSVDTAFLDRADVKVYIGPPCLEARCAMLHSSLDELVRVKIVRMTEETDWDGNTMTNSLYQQRVLSLALLADGLSGRSLRRLPLQAHAHVASSSPANMDSIPMVVFLNAVEQTIRMELESLKMMNND